MTRADKTMPSGAVEHEFRFQPALASEQGGRFLCSCGYTPRGWVPSEEQARYLHERHVAARRRGAGRKFRP